MRKLSWTDMDLQYLAMSSRLMETNKCVQDLVYDLRSKNSGPRNTTNKHE